MSEASSIDETVKSKIDILIEEYKVIKNDALVHIDFYNKQFSMFHFAILLIATFLGAYLKYVGSGDFSLSDFLKANQVYSIILFSFLLLYTFYHASVMMYSAFKFFVIRDRLGAIERHVNAIIKEKILRYEIEIAPIAYDRAWMGEFAPTPSALSATYRAGIFLLIFSFIVYSSGFYIHGVPYGLFLTFFFSNIVIFFNAARMIKRKNVVERLTNFERETDLIRGNFVSIFAGFILFSVTFCVVGFVVFTFLINTSSEFAGYRNELVERYGPESGILQNLYAFAYGFLASLPFSPLPSEAPLLLNGKVGWVALFVYPAIGKAVGFTLWFWILQRLLAKFPLTASLEKYRKNSFRGFIVRAVIVFRRRYSSTWFARMLAERREGYIWVFYLFFQSVPFFPMRSAVAVCAVLAPRTYLSIGSVLLLSIVGGVLRVVLMSYLISAGLLAFGGI